MAYIEFQGVSISYGEFPVLNNFNLEIEKGEVITLFGPSGCGKSTLMKALLNIIKPSKGRITIDGIKSYNYKKVIGYVPQDNQLLPWLTVEQNIKLWQKESKNLDKDLTNEVIRLVDLEPHKDKLPSELSGGMQRRTALARGLVTKTNILCLDEVLVSIERGLRRKLMYQIRDYVKRKNISTLVISHDYEEAIYLSDRTFVLSATPTEIIKSIEIKESSRGIHFFETSTFETYSQKLIN